MYDYVVIDEASQVDLATGGLALSCAKKAVVVGDLKQLPNVVDGEDKKRTDAIFKKYALPEAYRYSNHSLLSSMIELFPTAPKTLLREHYRCHPKIIGFCNQKFYDNLFITRIIRREKLVSKQETTIVLKCDCGCSMLVFDKEEWDDGKVNYNISVQDSRYDHNYTTLSGNKRELIAPIGLLSYFGCGSCFSQFCGNGTTLSVLPRGARTLRTISN